jgi:hypothetical protein
MLGLTAVVAIVTLLSSVALAGVVDPLGTYRDEFNQKGYTGSDGTEYWGDDPWKELGDDGSPTSGTVYVANGRLNVLSEGIEPLKEGVVVQRHADTSVFSRFELGYEIGFVGETGVVTVEKSIDGGEIWHQLAKYDLEDGFSKNPVISIGGPYEGTIIRFIVTGLQGELFIDDVELKGELATEPTTTTSSTSTTSTTTVVKTTTTTKVDLTTTTSRPEPTTTSSTTTTTRPGETTTTTRPGETTTTTRPEETTTTTQPETTSTSEAVIVPGSDNDPGDSGTPPEGSGIRQSARGIQASFDGQLFGDMPPDGGISGVDHQAAYRMAAEVIEASWAWLVILALVLAWSIVSGLEKRRSSTEA